MARVYEVDSAADWHMLVQGQHHLVGLVLGEHPLAAVSVTSATTLDDLLEAPEDPDYYRPW